MSKPHPAFKFWLETEDGYVFGPGVYSLLQRIEEKGNLKDAAESLGMSYRFAWGHIRKAEERLGASLITAHKGGKDGGGGAEVTELGRRYVAEFEALRVRIQALSGENSHSGVVEESRTVDGRTVILIALDSKTRLVKGDRVSVVN
jgi:molybdate transport repressor ModE-like protein